MLACIACLKKEHEDVGEGAKGSSREAANKGATKSLALQIKDMVMKFSGHRKGGGGTSMYYNKGNYGETSASYLRGDGSSSSQPWDFSRFGGGTSSRFPEDMVVLEEDDEETPKEWMAQVEPGVHITFLSIPGGNGNDLKRIRFNREMFNKWQAQQWWGENYDRIMELYNVQKFSRQALDTPSRSDDGGKREPFYSKVESFTMESPAATTPPSKMYTHPRAGRAPQSVISSLPVPSEHMIMDASRMTTSSAASLISMSNASCDTEIRDWVEQDEPGVFITIRQHPDGTRELRRVRFSREMFGEVRAKLYWEENRERIQSQYL